jgi:hypothetical protein
MRHTENFFTELVAEVLERDPAARRDFLDVTKRKEARNFRACEEVETQVSARLGRYHLLFDLQLKSGDKRLFVENKVDDKLRPSQIMKYLEYIHRRGKAWLLLASRDHNEIVEQARFKYDPRFVREVLWGEVADRWEAKKQTYKCKCLVESVLEFMEHHKMGPIRPFEGEEIDGTELGEGFHEKARGILIRLRSRLKEPAWVKDGRFQAHGVYPTGDGGGHLNFRSYKGLLWYYRPVEGPPAYADLWYFVGFRFGPPHRGLVRPLKAGQPDCIVYVSAERSDGMTKLMVGEAERLNTGLSAPIFEVKDSKNSESVLLFRRRQLKHFMEEGGNRTAAILNFLEESHKKLEAVVPKIHEHYRQGT